MATVPLDAGKVERCRGLANEIADDVQRYVARHTTVGVERAVLRAYGAQGTTGEGGPVVNVAVDRYAKAGLLGRGMCHFLGRALLRGARDPREAIEWLAFSADIDHGEGAPTLQAVIDALATPTAAALARIDAARLERDAFKGRLAAGVTPLKYVIVATGNIYDDAVQAKAAASAGADIVAVIRATAQSLLDYVPEGATTEGFGGTFATQENFRVIRRALDEASELHGRYVMQTNYSSGLCMAEIAWMASVERLDMLLNDAMYGILFRDINMCRTLVDQYVSRRFIARSGIVINTGEDNYLTTANAVDKAHTVLASQFINEALALRAGLRREQMGLGHAYEMDPWLEDSFLLEVAQAQLTRQIFDQHPIKWMPPTKHKTGDIFLSHVHDAMFDLAGVVTNQSIELLGMFSEAIHNPLLMDRYLALKKTRYVHGACRHLGDEIEFKKDGIIANRAIRVLGEALDLLVEVRRESIWEAIGRGAFADIKRARTGGKGYAGVFERDASYVNPLLSELEKG